MPKTPETKNVFRGGDIVYKCRRCGVVVKQMISGNLLTDLVVFISVMNDISGTGESDIRKHTIHSCEDGNLGVTDIVGGIYDED